MGMNKLITLIDTLQRTILQFITANQLRAKVTFQSTKSMPSIPFFSL